MFCDIATFRRLRATIRFTIFYFLQALARCSYVALFFSPRRICYNKPYLIPFYLNHDWVKMHFLAFAIAMYRMHPTAFHDANCFSSYIQIECSQKFQLSISFSFFFKSIKNYVIISFAITWKWRNVLFTNESWKSIKRIDKQTIEKINGEKKKFHCIHGRKAIVYFGWFRCNLWRMLSSFCTIFSYLIA